MGAGGGLHWVELKRSLSTTGTVLGISKSFMDLYNEHFKHIKVPRNTQTMKLTTQRPKLSELKEFAALALLGLMPGNQDGSHRTTSQSRDSSHSLVPTALRTSDNRRDELLLLSNTSGAMMDVSLNEEMRQSAALSNGDMRQLIDSLEPVDNFLDAQLLMRCSTASVAVHCTGLVTGV